jgi:hypothetical protein
MKSFSLVILKALISGVATTTLGLPPLYYNLASGSPNVRQTDNLPGKTLIGPIIKSGSYSYCVLWSLVIVDVVV